MTQDELDLLHGYLNGTIGEADFARLQSLLRENAKARRMVRDLSTVDAKLQECAAANPSTLRLLATSSARPRKTSPSTPWSVWLSWRPLTAVAAGLVIGLFSASMAWAYALPKVAATVSRLVALNDGGFEGKSGRLPSGLPVKLGVWSGDVAEVTSSDTITAKEGRQVLHFIRAKPDTNLPGEPADGCDVLQFVDLRPLRNEALRGNAVLELSASFADARNEPGEPVVFSCWIYVFQGQPKVLGSQWQRQANLEALSMGKADFFSTGSPGKPAWRTLTAKTVCPPQGDFALVLVKAARKGSSSGVPAEFGEQFADAVKLVLKTQPEAPVRFSNR